MKCHTYSSTWGEMLVIRIRSVIGWCVGNYWRQRAIFKNQLTYFTSSWVCQCQLCNTCKTVGVHTLIPLSIHTLIPLTVRGSQHRQRSLPPIHKVNSFQSFLKSIAWKIYQKKNNLEREDKRKIEEILSAWERTQWLLICKMMASSPTIYGWNFRSATNKLLHVLRSSSGFDTTYKELGKTSLPLPAIHTWIIAKQHVRFEHRFPFCNFVIWLYQTWLCLKKLSS